ncbi:hypothetical protein DY240_16345 [Jiangella rhizosphaerae]|uniref:Enoyl reductase (ER) domain-containing protein n=2 Tax=Jiangella rhizosphaerae TaxID=2293569 RepID=A0A418KPH2_9ACTN|nr:hypothetical protein DY240_16345 [Jiangella rhizosphaerae]
MRAARYHRYGGPDVLRVDTVHVPRPGPREVLVRVHGASVNPGDALFRSGRMRIGARLPRGTGLDLAGEVVAAGDRVDDLAAGDRVWAYRGGLPKRLGTVAEYAVMRADRCAPAPADADLVAAAALPTVGLTAPLPADRAFDAVADLHGARARDYRRLLAHGGRMATTATRAVPFALATALLPGPRIRIVQVRARRDDLVALTRYADDGALRPVVDRRYPLDQVAAAHRAVATGHARGKRVIDLT